MSKHAEQGPNVVTFRGRTVDLSRDSSEARAYRELQALQAEIDRRDARKATVMEALGHMQAALDSIAKASSTLAPLRQGVPLVRVTASTPCEHLAKLSTAVRKEAGRIAARHLRDLTSAIETKD